MPGRAATAQWDSYRHHPSSMPTTRVGWNIRACQFCISCPLLLPFPLRVCGASLSCSDRCGWQPKCSSQRRRRGDLGRPRVTTAKYLVRQGARLPTLAPHQRRRACHCHDALGAHQQISHSAVLGGTTEGSSVAAPHLFSMPAIEFLGKWRDGLKQQTTINHQRERVAAAAVVAGGSSP
jgi:hypothetical protein